MQTTTVDSTDNSSPTPYWSEMDWKVFFTAWAYAGLQNISYTNFVVQYMPLKKTT